MSKLRKKLSSNAERIVCVKCCEWKKTLLHKNGTYICEDCFNKIEEKDSEEMEKMKSELRKIFTEATFGGDENNE